MGEPASAVQMVDWLETQIEEAAGAMSQELGDRSVCTAHKDGRVTGGLKYQEGRMSALAAMRRELVRGEQATEVIAAADEQWSAEFETRRRARPSSPTWVSYATGGREAVRDVRKRFGVSFA